MVARTVTGTRYTVNLWNADGTEPEWQGFYGKQHEAGVSREESDPLPGAKEIFSSANPNDGGFGLKG